MSKTFTVATRRSALALAQCRAWMAEFTQATGHALDELHVVTTGDRIVDRPLNAIGGKGLFIKEIEAAILEGRASLAVHSMKDVPAELAPGLSIACVPRREDPRDAVKTTAGCRLLELPVGSRVGTSSLRRTLQLRAARPDLKFVPIRGNVDTRLKRCDEGVVDAVVLAYAGLKRLGLEEQVTEVLEPEVCLPAIGQGALAIEIRTDDAELRSLLAVVEDDEATVCTAAERGVLRAAEGNCSVPIAGYARRSEGQLHLRALLAEADGSRVRSRDLIQPWPDSAEEAHAMGLEVGRELKAG